MKKNAGFIIGLVFIEFFLIIGGVSLLSSMLPFGIALFVVAFVVLIYVISTYNKVVRYKNKVKESLSLIDIQLKLRFDLIPNLVSVVKKYATHEKEVLTEIVKLRKLAEESHDEKEKIEYANKVLPQLKNIIAIAEDYPDLKSSALFRSLMEQIADAEDRIAASRRIYDSNVSRYNTAIEQFPSNMIAKAFGYEREVLFRIDVGENIVPKIDLGDK